jgi:hypothetical protein
VHHHQHQRPKQALQDDCRLHYLSTRSAHTESLTPASFGRVSSRQTATGAVSNFHLKTPSPSDSDLPVSSPDIAPTPTAAAAAAPLVPGITAPPLLTFSTVYSFCWDLFQSAQLEPECLVVALIFVRTFLAAEPAFRLHARNWQRLTFVALMLASKAIDDVSCSSRSFARCVPKLPSGAPLLSLPELNRAERLFFTAVDFHLFVTAKEYAHAYFDVFVPLWSNLELVDESTGEICPRSFEVVEALGLPDQLAPGLLFRCAEIGENGGLAPSPAAGLGSLPIDQDDQDLAALP